MTAVVCCYNGEGYLRDLLRAIEAQTIPVAETIVVDNASTDRSREIVRAEFPRARLVELPSNDGPCVPRNRGLEEARTPWVFALDCDVVPAPDCLERLLDAVELDPGLALAEPRALDERDRGLVQYDGGHFHYTGLLALRNFHVPLARAEGRGTVAIDAAVALALLVDREKVLAYGGYDPAFFILFEDNDLSYRLRSAGERIAAVEEAIVVHRGGTAGTSFRQGMYPKRRVFLHSRNRWLFLAKSYQLSTIARGLPGLLAYELVAAAFAVAKLAPLAYLHGKASFLRHLPAALRARRATAARRRVRDAELVRGGPLTLWPGVATGRLSAGAARGLEGALRGWWRLAGGRA